MQHYKLWGGAVSSLQCMLCCINREWLAAPAKNYIVLSVESDSANFFENFKDTLYLIIFFSFVLLRISLLLKFWIPGTLCSLPKKEKILILGERNCSIVFFFCPHHDYNLFFGINRDQKKDVKLFFFLQKWHHALF